MKLLTQGLGCNGMERNGESSGAFPKCIFYSVLHIQNIKLAPQEWGNKGGHASQALELSWNSRQREDKP